LDTNESGELLICTAAHALRSCLFTDEAPGTVWAVDLTPYCQGDGPLAISFEILRDPEASIFVYFVDGATTLDREEAQSWAAYVPACTIPPPGPAPDKSE
jgi:hypothetical protein